MAGSRLVRRRVLLHRPRFSLVEWVETPIPPSPDRRQQRAGVSLVPLGRGPPNNARGGSWSWRLFGVEEADADRILCVGCRSRRSREPLGPSSQESEVAVSFSRPAAPAPPHATRRLPRKRARGDALFLPTPSRRQQNVGCSRTPHLHRRRSSSLSLAQFTTIQSTGSPCLSSLSPTSTTFSPKSLRVHLEEIVPPSASTIKNTILNRHRHRVASSSPLEVRSPCRSTPTRVRRRALRSSVSSPSVLLSSLGRSRHSS